MAPEAPGSSIRVFIRWHDQTVFAGEDVKCRITFKNVAPSQPTPATSNHHSKSSPHLQRTPASARPGQPSPLHGGARPKPSPGLAPPVSARGHRSSLSLTVPSPKSRQRSDSTPWTPPAVPENRPASNGHRRSISIVSIGSSSTVDGQASSVASSAASPRPNRGHTRASSLQISSRGGMANGPRSGASLFLGHAFKRED
jgi:RAB6A-GEF complex partner protein 2